MQPIIDLKEIERELKKPGKSKSGLAQHMGWNNSTVSSIFDKKKKPRKIKADEVPRILEYLNLDKTVPIVGIVRAGGEAYYPEPADLGRAIMVTGAGPDTVAVEIQGNSLGAEWDGWIAYYDYLEKPPSPALYGRLCVVWLKDGRIVIKKLQPALGGRYHLVSSGETITDVEVRWAARVIDVKPRDLAVK